MVQPLSEISPEVHPRPRAFVRVPSAERPILTVVVDTEEEFDWSGPFSRSNTRVDAMRHVERLQAVFDEFSVVPCYAIDYPIVAQPAGYECLRKIYADGRCEIGAHLHPWVNPPHEEQVNTRNSFPGNLPRDLERRKIEVLNKKIEAVFGERPIVYKAGRFGIGANTEGILEELGFEVDVSPMAGFDYSEEGGPNFEQAPLIPWWFGDERRLLCIPGTGALVGILGPFALSCYRACNRAPLRALKIPGVLARLRLVDRLRLSVEGYSLGEMKRLTRFLVGQGVRVFSTSLHSSSMLPGSTPYAKDESDLREILQRLRGYLEFFTRELAGRTMSPGELRDFSLACETDTKWNGRDMALQQFGQTFD